MALLPGSPAIDAGTTAPASPPPTSAAMAGSAPWTSAPSRARGSLHSRPRQQPPDGAMIGDDIRQPAGREGDGQQPGRAGERRRCHVRCQSRDQRRHGVSCSGLLGRHRQTARPPSPPRPTTWIGSYHVSASASGSSPGHLRPHQHRPGLHHLIVNTTSDSLFPGTGL